MKQCAAAVMAVALMGAAACDDSPTAPDNNTVVFTANMTASSEVPPVSGAEAAATGTATITFRLTRSTAGAITAATATFSANVAGMPAGTSLIRAHIHTGGAGVAGGVLVDTGLTPAAAIAIVNGTGTLTFNGVTVDPTAVENIISNPAGFYFNVHSAANPGGVVRGQLVRQSS